MKIKVVKNVKQGITLMMANAQVLSILQCQNAMKIAKDVLEVVEKGAVYANLDIITEKDISTMDLIQNAKFLQEVVKV